MEFTLRGMVWKFSWGADDPSRGVHEFRRFYSDKSERQLLSELPPESLDWYCSQTDAELIEQFKLLPRRQETSPILDAILASPATAFAFSDNEIKKLGEVKWQIYQLKDAAQWQNELVRLTFTVDAARHPGVVENHTKAMRTYRISAEHTLDNVRDGLKMLED
jgi:hypothetical protein